MSNSKVRSGDINSSFGFDKLVEFLSSDNYRIRAAAAKAIGQKKHKETLPILLNALKTEKTGPVISKIAGALAQFESLDEAAVDILLERTQKVQYTWGLADIILNSARDATVSKIISLFNGRPRNQASLLYILSEIGDPRVLELLYKKGRTDFENFTDTYSLEFHAKKLASPDKDTRMQAVWGLSAFQTETATNYLLLAARDPHYQVKNLAIEVLGSYARPAVTDLLLSILQNDTRKTTRVEAAKALTAHGTPEALSGIRKAIQAELDHNSGDDSENSYFIQELVKARNPIILTYLEEGGLIYSDRLSEYSEISNHIKMLSSPVQETRKLAIENISRFQTPQASSVLIRAAEDPNYRVRAAAVKALKDYKTPEVTEFLVKLLKNNPSTSVRASAVTSIREHGVLDVIPVIALAHIDEELGVRQEAAYALWRYGGTRAIERTARGVYHHNIREYQEAADCFSQALELDPNNGLALYYRAKVYRRTAKNEKALIDLDRYLDSQPQDPYEDGYSIRGTIKFEAEDLEGAAEDFQKSIGLHPAKAAYYHLYRIYMREGRYKETIKVLSTFIKYRPEVPFGYVRRAFSFMKIGEYHNAIRDYTKLIEFADSDSPSLDECYASRAECYFKVGFIEAALNDIDHAFELNPQPSFLASRAFYQMEWGDYEEAIADCTKILAENDEGALLEGLRIRAACYIKRGEMGKAQVDTRRLLDLEPENAWGLFHQARIFADQGDQDLALKYLDAALQQDTEGFIERIKASTVLSGLRENPAFSILVSEYDE